MHRTPWQLLLLIAALSALGTGCSGGDDFTEAGPLVLLSVEPVSEEAVVSDNLLPNPYYSEMYAGAPAPVGWVAPSERDNSLITRKPVPNEDDRFMIQQAWDSQTGPRGLADFFKTEILHLKPETRYRLAVTGVDLSGTSASVSVATMEQDGTFSYVARDLLKIEAGAQGRQALEGEFKTGTSGDIFICTHRNASTKYEDEAGRALVLWFDWSLNELNTGSG